MSLKSKWLLFSIIGLVLVGAGLSIFGEALLLKFNPLSSFQSWFWMGTLSLVLINSGLSFIGQAVIYKIRFERNVESSKPQA